MRGPLSIVDVSRFRRVDRKGTVQVATHATIRAIERPLRRVPVQGRSVARVARMLDACAELVDEVGCDGLTTTLLAERARVAIGSVYQFFPDKQAVIRALSARNFEEYLSRLEARFADLTLGDWSEVADVAIDEYVAMHRTVPGFRTLRVGRVDSDCHSEADPGGGSAVARRLIALIADRFAESAMPPSEVLFSITVAIEVADALVTTAFRQDRDGDRAMLDECGALIRDYLRRRLSLAH